jgi:hypothetical protein
LEVCATADGDNRDQSFSAFRAARCSIHEILPDLHYNPEVELMFHSTLQSDLYLGCLARKRGGGFRSRAHLTWLWAIGQGRAATCLPRVDFRRHGHCF